MTKPIGLASSPKVNFKKICVTISFLPCSILYLGEFPSISPRGLTLGGAI